MFLRRGLLFAIFLLFGCGRHETQKIDTKKLDEASSIDAKSTSSEESGIEAKFPEALSDTVAAPIVPPNLPPEVPLEIPPYPVATTIYPGLGIPFSVGGGGGRRRRARCGNGVKEFHEICDDGKDSATCDEDCTLVECGDGHTNEAAGEECDDKAPSVTCDENCKAIPLTFDSLVSFGRTCTNTTLEDFEDTKVTEFNVISCDGPIDASTSNACVDPQDIAAGIQIATSNISSPQLALLGKNFLVAVTGFTAPSNMIGANFFSEQTNLTFFMMDNEINCFGLDVYNAVATPDTNQPVIIRVFDSNDNLILTTQTAAGFAGSFFGVALNSNLRSISRIEFGDSASAEIIDNLRFGPLP